MPNLIGKTYDKSFTFIKCISNDRVLCVEIHEETAFACKTNELNLDNPSWVSISCCHAAAAPLAKERLPGMYHSSHCHVAFLKAFLTLPFCQGWTFHKSIQQIKHVAPASYCPLDLSNILMYTYSVKISKEWTHSLTLWSSPKLRAIKRWVLGREKGIWPSTHRRSAHLSRCFPKDLARTRRTGKLRGKNAKTEYWVYNVYTLKSV